MLVKVKSGKSYVRRKQSKQSQMNKLSLITIGVLSLVLTGCDHGAGRILDNNVEVVWTSYDEYELNAQEMLQLPHVELSLPEKQAVARGLELLDQLTEEEMMIPVPAAVVGDIMKQKTGDYRFICNEKVVLSISEHPPYFHELLSMNRPEEWGGIVKQMSSKMEQARKMRN